MKRYREETLRHHMVRIAGMTGERWLPLAIRLEMSRAYRSFGAQFSRMVWGPAPPPRVVLVSVPRRLRPRFGRYVKDSPGKGRKRKDRRKHNRRWMPEQDEECEC